MLANLSCGINSSASPRRRPGLAQAYLARRFGDWMLSTHDSYRLLGPSQVVTITNAEWDCVPDTAFAMLADVKAKAPKP